MVKQSTQMWTVALALVAIVLVVAGFSTGWFGLSTTQGGGAGSTGSGACDVAPSLDLSSVNALERSTSVTTGYQAIINDNPAQSVSDGDTMPNGATVQLFANASDYLNTIDEKFTVDCGVNQRVIELLATDSMTLEILEDSTTLTDSASGGASNFSNVGVGGVDTFTLKITGKDKKATGDLIYVIEMGDNSNVSSVTMSGATEVSVPEFYSETLSSPEVVAFKIPGFTGAVENEYKVTFALKSGKDISGAVYTTVYSEQAFVEDDGTFKSGVENEDGDVKYEDTYDYDFFIASS